MPLTVLPVDNSNRVPRLSKSERREKKERVAAEVGGAAGLSTTATRMASKRGLNAENAENTLHQMMNRVQNTARVVQKNTKTANGILSTFKVNFRMYTDDILRRFEAVKTSKFIGPLLNNPIARKFASAAGGVLAFFVLITGVNKAFKTGAIAVDDLKNQYTQYKAVA